MSFIYHLLLEKIVFNLFSLKRYSVFWYLKQIKLESRLSEQDVYGIQKKRLSLILRHALTTVDFYKSIKGLHEPFQDPYDKLRQFPIIDKYKLNDFNEALKSSKFKGKKVIYCFSSGSSGLRSECILSKREIAKDRAIQILWWQWAGVKFGYPILQTGMDAKRSLFKKIKDIVFRTRYIHAFSMNSDDVNNILSSYMDVKYIVGYASSLYNISELVNEDISQKLSIKASVSWGDKLFSKYKHQFKQKFGVTINETYGCAEGIKMAAQLDLDYMYIMSPNIIVEILDDNDNPVKDGEMGHVVITSLDRYAMPMIRYKIGDLGVLLPKNKYPKNRKLNYQLIEKIIGRDTDIVILPDNSKLTVHSFTGIVEYIAEISQFRIIQKNINSIDFEYITNKKFDNISICDAIKDLNIKFKALINRDDFSINFYEVDSIPSTKSGKPQIICSEISKIRLANNEC